MGFHCTIPLTGGQQIAARHLSQLSESSTQTLAKATSALHKASPAQSMLLRTVSAGPLQCTNPTLPQPQSSTKYRHFSSHSLAYN